MITYTDKYGNFNLEIWYNKIDLNLLFKNFYNFGNNHWIIHKTLNGPTNNIIVTYYDNCGNIYKFNRHITNHGNGYVSDIYSLCCNSFENNYEKFLSLKNTCKCNRKNTKLSDQIIDQIKTLTSHENYEVILNMLIWQEKQLEKEPKITTNAELEDLFSNLTNINNRGKDFYESEIERLTKIAQDALNEIQKYQDKLESLIKKS